MSGVGGAANGCEWSLTLFLLCDGALRGGSECGHSFWLLMIPKELFFVVACLPKSLACWGFTQTNGLTELLLSLTLVCT